MKIQQLATMIWQISLPPRICYDNDWEMPLLLLERLIAIEHGGESEKRVLFACPIANYYFQVVLFIK